MAGDTERSIAPKVRGSKALAAPEDDWENRFINSLDSMVQSFLSFPAKYSEDYRDGQFARHLLWRIGDERSKFLTLLLKGTTSQELGRFWVHLMPFIDGRFPERVSYNDVRLVELNFRMYEIVKSIFYDEGESFDTEMDKVIQTIRYVREM